MIVQAVTAVATEPMVALLDVVTRAITTLITPLKRDLNAFIALTNVKLVIMRHTVLCVKTTFGVGSADTAAAIAAITVTRFLDAEWIANWAIIQNG